MKQTESVIDNIDNNIELQTITALIDELRRGKRYLITSHARPDGDAVGSVLALAMLLDQFGKQVDLVLADRVPPIYSGLPGVERIRQSSHVEGDYDAAILLECNGMERTGLTGLETMRLINIDHHISGSNFGSFNWIDTNACAVAAMVCRIVSAAQAELTPQMATCLYAAVLTDTGSFTYKRTDAATFSLAHDLVLHGARPAYIANEIYYSNRAAKIRLLGAALSSLHQQGPIAWVSVGQQDVERTHATDEDCEGVVNHVIGINGVEVALFLRELNDGAYHVSLRGKNSINVAETAEAFGGGGHENASGCTIAGPFTSAIERLLAKLKSQGIAAE